MYISVYYIYIVMQQKFFSVIYKLKYYRTFVEISFDFESVCRFVKCSAYALNVCNRNQKNWPKYAKGNT